MQAKLASKPSMQRLKAPEFADFKLFANTPRNWAQFYGEFRVSREFYLRLADLLDIVELLAPAGAEVLLVGTGSSGMGEELSALGHFVTGIDFSKAVVERLQALAESQSQYLHMDARSMRFPDETFSLVVCKAVLEFQQDLNAVHQILSEAHRVLQRGGSLLLVTQLDAALVDDFVALQPWESVHKAAQLVSATCLNGNDVSRSVNVFVCVK